MKNNGMHIEDPGPNQPRISNLESGGGGARVCSFRGVLTILSLCHGFSTNESRARVPFLTQLRRFFFFWLGQGPPNSCPGISKNHEQHGQEICWFSTPVSHRELYAHDKGPVHYPRVYFGPATRSFSQRDRFFTFAGSASMAVRQRGNESGKEAEFEDATV